jgi:hypothetical protein
VNSYDLDRWLFTREILIRSYVKPNRHPILTLNTRQIDNGDARLGTLLHEQFYWLAATRLEKTEAVISDFREMFPSVCQWVCPRARRANGNFNVREESPPRC